MAIRSLSLLEYWWLPILMQLLPLSQAKTATNQWRPALQSLTTHTMAISRAYSHHYCAATGSWSSSLMALMATSWGWTAQCMAIRSLHKELQRSIIWLHARRTKLGLRAISYPPKPVACPEFTSHVIIWKSMINNTTALSLSCVIGRLMWLRCLSDYQVLWQEPTFPSLYGSYVRAL